MIFEKQSLISKALLTDKTSGSYHNLPPRFLQHIMFLGLGWAWLKEVGCGIFGNTRHPLPRMAGVFPLAGRGSAWAAGWLVQGAHPRDKGCVTWASIQRQGILFSDQAPLLGMVLPSAMQGTKSSGIVMNQPRASVWLFTARCFIRVIHWH